MRKIDEIYNSMLGKNGGYTGFCDYIESDGNGQYIDTGLKGYNDTTFKFHYLQCVNTTEAGIFGAYNYNNGGATTANELCAYFSLQHMYYGKSNGWTNAITAIFPNNKQYTLDVIWQGGNATKFILTNIDTDEVLEPTMNRVLTETSMTLLLFAVNEATTGSVIYNVNSLKMGRVERHDNNVLTQDFRPYVDNDIAGMLDVVNDVFYPSANGVNFLYGNF